MRVVWPEDTHLARAGSVGDQSAVQRTPGEREALLVLRQVPDFELVKQSAKLRLDRLHAQHELIGVRLCGEAQAITEPYVPNLCERCEPPDLTAQGL